MGMLDGKYYVVYLSGGLEGVTEDREKLLQLLRDDYCELLRLSYETVPDESEFDLKIKFDKYTLTWRGGELRAWYAINVQAL